MEDFLEMILEPFAEVLMEAIAGIAVGIATAFLSEVGEAFFSGRARNELAERPLGLFTPSGPSEQ
jgi:hypothetical protein